MYQTLYRKYRPKTFDEVVGQHAVVKTLKNAIANNCLNHAYLFTGPRGTGKTSIAKILAKTINCSCLENLIPCEECPSCTQINDHQSIDILEIDAASNNGVDEIREIRNKVNLVPSVGKYKVYIVDEVHMLTTGAFNALLKTLEEPPSHIIFILATTEPHKIPATILSRCQRFDFKKIGINEMVPYLKQVAEKEKVKIEDEALFEIARLSDGCMRDALSILDQVIAFSPDEIKIEDVHEINGTLSQKELEVFVHSLLNKDYQNIFKMIDNYDNHGKNFIKLSEEIILFFRNLLLLMNVPDYFKTLDYDETIYENLVKEFDEQKVFNFLNSFIKAIPDMKKSNHARIMFEMIILDLIQIQENQVKQVESTKNNNELIKTNISKPTTLTTKQEVVEEVNIIKEKATAEVEEIKTEEEKNQSSSLNYDVEILKNIRVNNTLCNFNKNEFKSFIDRIDEIRSLIINPDYSEYASMVIDGDLRALGKENMIFVFSSERDSNQFNQNLPEIDSMLKDYFEISYKTIAVSKEEWEKIKQEFNSKQKTYTYMQEPNISKTKSNDKNELEKMFSDIIEYV